MANPKVTTAAKAALESERAELLHQLAEFGTGEGSMSFDENFADSGQVAAEQGEHRALIGRLEEALTDVEHALGKVEDGTYGKCEVCGEDIAAARLEALPASRYCINHA